MADYKHEELLEVVFLEVRAVECEEQNGFFRLVSVPACHHWWHFGSRIGHKIDVDQCEISVIVPQTI
ncbi:MAG: hypothetical protein HYX25_07550 [Candidatus Solibacter usitatus]|nr:hypothetical protein [Candidatus Solibacter usitatus]